MYVYICIYIYIYARGSIPGGNGVFTELHVLRQ